MARPTSLIDLFLKSRKKAAPLITLDEGVPTVQLGDQFDVAVSGPEGDIASPEPQRGQRAQAGVDKWFAQHPEGASASNKDQEGPTL